MRNLLEKNKDAIKAELKAICPDHIDILQIDPNKLPEDSTEYSEKTPAWEDIIQVFLVAKGVYGVTLELARIKDVIQIYFLEFTIDYRIIFSEMKGDDCWIRLDIAVVEK